MPTERITINLPDAFDPAKHAKALEKLIGEKYGEGWELEHIDPAKRTASATRQPVTTEVTAAEDSKKGDKGADRFDVRVAKGTKPSDGDKISVKLEDQYEGYYVTSFEPFLGRATLTRLDDGTARCRGAVAVALGVKPWQVQCRPRRGGGYELELPTGYVPSRHDDKLEEVATAVVGELGWTVQVNAQKLTASLIPGKPPTFPGTIPYPFDQFANSPRDRVQLGWKLSKPGGTDGEPLWLDFDQAAHAMVSGTSGSGKSVTLNALVAGALAGGAQVAVIDVPHKALDFTWMRDFCRTAGWGCESLRHSVACITMLYREGERRAAILSNRGVTKWTELPPDDQFPPILILIDEVTGLIQLDDVPKGLPKDHPLVTEAQQSNLLRQTLLGYMKKIAAEMRFVGLRLVLSSQVSSTNTGVPTALRLNLANKALMGSNPTSNNRKLALSDPTSVPEVPPNVRESEQASRGVGVAEFEAQPPSVFKSYFATSDQYRQALLAMGVPTRRDFSPTSADIARHTPSLDEDLGGGSSSFDDDSVFDSGKGVAAGVKPVRATKAKASGSRSTAGLSGAVASAGSVSAAFKSQETCATCDGPIDALTGNCHCSW